MRNIDRDRQRVFISRFGGLTPEQDEDGRYTGRHITERSEPIEFWPTVSAARGESQTDYFGNYIDYDRTITIDDPDFKVEESDVLWLDKSIDESHDYEVKRVARTKGFTVIAAKRVEVSR